MDATACKEEGNAAYGSGQYERAITCYSEGLAADIEGCLAPTLLGNRSQVRTPIGLLGTPRTGAQLTPHLPDMAGSDLLPIIKTVVGTRDTRIVMLSVNSEQKLVQKCLQQVL